MTHLHSKGSKSQTKFALAIPRKILLALLVASIIAMSDKPVGTAAAPVASSESQSSQTQQVDPTYDPNKAVKNAANVPMEPPKTDPSWESFAQYQIRPDSLDLSERSARKSQDKLDFTWQQEEEEESGGLEFSGSKSD